MKSLFEFEESDNMSRPLADILRPQNLNDVVGQQQLAKKVINQIVKK